VEELALALSALCRTRHVVA